jgi:hypothetical protein
MNKTSPKRKKAMQDANKKRKEYETWNGDLAGINVKSIIKAFPNLQERNEYLKALADSLAIAS